MSDTLGQIGKALKRFVKYMAPVEFAQRERIATLESRVKVLETLEPEYKRLVNKLEELEKELATHELPPLGAQESPCD